MDEPDFVLPKGRTIAIDGDAVRTLRIQKGLSVADLAANADMSIDRIMKIEKGGQKVYASNLINLAQALGLGEDWRPLLEGAKHPAGTHYFKAKIEIVTPENTSKAEISIPIDKEKTSHYLNAFLVFMNSIVGVVIIFIIAHCLLDIRRLFNHEWGGAMPAGPDYVADTIWWIIVTRIPFDVIATWLLAKWLHMIIGYLYLTYTVYYHRYYKAWRNKRRS